jgi:4-amino-4-deoxy-L-arabinose transferase-like glycosyltransferase
MSKKKEQYVLGGVLAITLFASLSYAFSFQIEPTVDARAYDGIAQEILATGEYPNGAIGRPGPGYEYFLALIYKITGHSYPAVWITQAILLACIALMVWYATKIIAGENWHPMMGTIAALLVGLSPDLILISAMLMTEIIMLFFLTASILAFLYYTEKKQLYLLIVSAICIGLSALVRGNIILVAIPFIIFLFYKKGWAKGVLFTVVLIATLTPWTIHNYQEFEKIIPFNASPGLLYVGNHEGATGELMVGYPLPESVQDPTLTQFEFDSLLGKEGVKYILTHPLDFIKLTVWRISIYFSLARPFAFWTHLTGAAKFATIFGSTLYATIIFIMGFGGIKIINRTTSPQNKERFWLIGGLIAMTVASVAPLVVETRYRFASYPLLAIVAGIALVTIAVSKEKKALIKSALLIIVLIGANTLFDIARNWDRIIERIL